VPVVAAAAPGGAICKDHASTGLLPGGEPDGDESKQWRGILVELAFCWISPLLGLSAKYQLVQNFITVNNNAGDVGPEATVLGEVGSYGYQLSRIIDAVQVIVDQLEKSPGLGDLSTDQQQSLAKLRQLAKDVDASVNGYWMRRG
jgi:hypothetical protein